jgi:hypothetical protein
MKAPATLDSGCHHVLRENTGMALGLLGVVIFSLTLPFTRIVVQELHPLLNGLGRACSRRFRRRRCCSGDARNGRPGSRSKA